MKRLGSAEIGVGVSAALLLLLLLASAALMEFVPSSFGREDRLVLRACGCCFAGGGGRAKGFEGPVAPGERAFADVGLEGEGGGRTTEPDLECELAPLLSFSAEFATAAREEALLLVLPERVFPGDAVAASAVEPTSSSDEASAGICTVKRGRLVSEAMLSTLETGFGTNGGEDCAP